VFASRLARFVGIEFKSSPLLGEVWKLATHFQKIIRINKLGYFCTYFKVSTIVILSYLGGIPLTTTTQLGLRVGLSNGLPSYLPRRWRALIRSRSLPHMRLILSITALYRSFSTTYKEPDFSKISTPPFEGTVPSSFGLVCRKVLSRFRRYFLPSLLLPDWEDSKSAWSTSSGPNGRPSYSARGKDYLGLKTSGLWPAINEWLDLACDFSTEKFAKTLSQTTAAAFGTLSDVVGSAVETLDYGDQMKLWSSDTEGQKAAYPVGKLSVKPEAAGKLRIFAIGDWWTQTLLSPLHKAMEKVLSHFPQDATFDQEGKTKEFASRGYQKFWSFDLTSATDLIPQQVYIPVMAVLLGSDRLAKLWLRLLTDREFFYKEPRCKSTGVNGEITFHRYTRGQPMGIKSSWPALAITHHLIVLYAAWLVGLDPLKFKDYLVLGDDVVIANEKVAESYLKVTSDLEIPIGLAKSFAGAKGFFQFANQNWLNGVNISPVSLKADLAVQKFFWRYRVC
jgi:hypothetical protein